MLRDNELWGETISVYSRDNALQDGVLFKYSVENFNIAVSASLRHQYAKEPHALQSLVSEGLRLLTIPDPEDSSTLRLRSFRDGQVWVTCNNGGEITFFRPEEY